MVSEATTKILQQDKIEGLAKSRTISSLVIPCFLKTPSQVLESQCGLPGSNFQKKEVPRDSSLLAPETETETVCHVFRGKKGGKLFGTNFVHLDSLKNFDCISMSWISGQKRRKVIWDQFCPFG